MSSSSNSDSENDGELQLERVPVPSEFFTYRGEAKKDGNSLYKCLHCAVGPNKTISCSDRSRLNLKKHIKVCMNLILLICLVIRCASSSIIIKKQSE
jgi:hypothetical protein